MRMQVHRVRMHGWERVEASAVLPAPTVLREDGGDLELVWVFPEGAVDELPYLVEDEA
jgi:hypothetical protein